MNSLICISHVPDTTTKIKFTEDGTALDKNGVTFVINPYDEFGLSRALEFREGGIEGEITALCVGSAEVEPTLRKALAVGADKAIRVDAEPTDALFVAKQIAEHVKANDYQLVWLGKESIDNNGAEVPGMVAELLGWPFVSYATKVEVDGGKVMLEREIDGGVEKLEADMPVVISTQKGVAEWRIPNMRGIMAAKRKPLEVVEAASAEKLTETVHYELPPPKPGVKMLEEGDVDSIVDILVKAGAL